MAIVSRTGLVSEVTSRESHKTLSDHFIDSSSSGSSPESSPSKANVATRHQFAEQFRQYEEEQNDQAIELAHRHPNNMPHFDGLAHTINYVFSRAVVANAQWLRIDMVALRDMHLMKSPYPDREDVPDSLKPIKIQYRVVHDPVIDTIPHSRLRHNILRSLSMAQLDEKVISWSLRTSGGLVEENGVKMRCGLIAWGQPEDPEAWELTDGFVFRFGHLLQGCEDLIASTNEWRSRRGEPPLSSHQAMWDRMISQVA